MAQKENQRASTVHSFGSLFGVPILTGILCTIFLDIWPHETAILSCRFLRCLLRSLLCHRNCRAKTRWTTRAEHLALCFSSSAFTYGTSWDSSYTGPGADHDRGLRGLAWLLAAGWWLACIGTQVPLASHLLEAHPAQLSPAVAAKQLTAVSRS